MYMQPLNDFKFADLSYSTYKCPDFYSFRVFDAEGTMIDACSGFSSEQKAVEFVENSLLNKIYMRI